jgi:hypothetical protein
MRIISCYQKYSWSLKWTRTPFLTSKKAKEASANFQSASSYLKSRWRQHCPTSNGFKRTTTKRKADSISFCRSIYRSKFIRACWVNWLNTNNSCTQISHCGAKMSLFWRRWLIRSQGFTYLSCKIVLYLHFSTKFNGATHSCARRQRKYLLWF